MPCADCSTDDDRGCFCGPGEMCGDCFESLVKPEDMPKILKVVSEPEPSSSSDVCVCGHAWAGHQYGPRCIGNRNLCTCLAFRTVTLPGDPLYPECPQGNGSHCRDHGPYCCHCGVRLRDVPEEEAPEPPKEPEPPKVLHKWKGCEQCRHREHASFCPVCRCLAVTSLEEITRTCQQAGGCPEHPVQEDEEPPLTPEEEEEVAPDSVLPCTCAAVGEEKHAEDCDALLAPYHGEHGYPPEDAPPQPERRPPYAVTYSVSGHLFEVALSGDATVRAVDGALVIQHHLGPVAGIVSVLPVINKED